MNTKGKAAEDFAADYLLNKGYRLTERNFSCRFGEIDIICSDEQNLVFCEVKARKKGSIASGRESIDNAKIRKIQKTALWYISGHKTTLQPRFDVIEITGSEGAYTVTAHIINAF